MSSEQFQKKAAISALRSTLKDSARRNTLILLVCGPTLEGPPGEPLRESAVLRKYVTEQARLLGHTVFHGEEKNLMRLAKKTGPVQVDVASAEILLACAAVHKVIIIPDSPGSFAELGTFCRFEKLRGKMLVIFDKKYRKDRGFVVHVLSKSAKNLNARVCFRDYSKPANIWKLIVRELGIRQMDLVLNEISS